MKICGMEFGIKIKFGKFWINPSNGWKKELKETAMSDQIKLKN